MPLQAEGEFALVRQKLEPTLGLEGQPVKRGTMAHDHIVYMMLADAAAQARHSSSLAEYAPLIEELAQRDGHEPYLAVAHRARGVADVLDGRYAEAETRLQQALAIFENMGARWQVGRTQMELGEVDRAQADAAAAQAHFSAALEAFEALDAGPDIEQARKALAELA